MTSHDFNTIAAVVYRFFAGLDTRDHAASAALMAENGIWNRQGNELAGSAAVLAALEKRDPKRQTAHIVTNLWIEDATANTARVRFYMSAYEIQTGNDGQTGAPQFLGVRACIDELVKEGDQWRILMKTSRRFLPAE